jgi:hypothetical protein
METRKAFLLRVNAALWREIEAWAQEDFRSVNGQIEYLLRQALLQRRRARAGTSPGPDLPSSGVDQDGSDRVGEPEPSPPPRGADSSSGLEVGRQD